MEVEELIEKMRVLTLKERDRCFDMIMFKDTGDDSESHINGRAEGLNYILDALYRISYDCRNDLGWFRSNNPVMQEDVQEGNACIIDEAYNNLPKWVVNDEKLMSIWFSEWVKQNPEAFMPKSNMSDVIKSFYEDGTRAMKKANEKFEKQMKSLEEKQNAGNLRETHGADHIIDKDENLNLK